MSSSVSDDQATTLKAEKLLTFQRKRKENTTEPICNTRQRTKLSRACSHVVLGVLLSTRTMGCGAGSIPDGAILGSVWDRCPSRIVRSLGSY